MPASLHAEALAWLRYGKHMPLVATECGYWSADVLGIDENKCIEVEVKKTISDLRAEFRNKTKKHETFARLEPDGRAMWSPNYFWIFTYAHLGAQALKVLEELGMEHVGLAVLQKESTTVNGAGHWVSILRHAPKLHNGKPHKKLIRALQLRMGSELVSLRVKLELLKNAAPEQIAAIIKEASELALQLTERPDWENEEATAGQNQPGPESV